MHFPWVHTQILKLTKVQFDIEFDSWATVISTGYDALKEQAQALWPKLEKLELDDVEEVRQHAENKYSYLMGYGYLDELDD